MKKQIRWWIALAVLAMTVAGAVSGNAQAPEAELSLSRQGEEIELRIAGIGAATGAAVIRLSYPEDWKVSVAEGKIESRTAPGSLILLLEGDLSRAVALRVERPAGSAGSLLATPADRPGLCYVEESGTGSRRLVTCRLEGARLELPAAETETEAETVPETDPPDDLPNDLPNGGTHYIGCQEALTAQGLSVRFLFRVADGAAPAAAVWIRDRLPGESVCAPTPGRLSAGLTDEVSVPGGSWSAGEGYGIFFYTYEGLPTTGGLCFSVWDGEGEWRIWYREGEYAGCG